MAIYSGNWLDDEDRPFDPGAQATNNDVLGNQAQVRRLPLRPTPSQIACRQTFTRLMRIYADDAPPLAKQEWQDEGEDRDHENRWFQEIRMDGPALFVCLNMPPFYQESPIDEWLNLGNANMLDSPGVFAWNPFPTHITWTVGNLVPGQGPPHSGIIAIVSHENMAMPSMKLRQYTLAANVSPCPPAAGEFAFTFPCTIDPYSTDGVAAYVRWWHGHNWWSDGAAPVPIP